jgi:hypothetical protein
MRTPGVLVPDGINSFLGDFLNTLNYKAERATKALLLKCPIAFGFMQFFLVAAFVFLICLLKTGLPFI